MYLMNKFITQVLLAMQHKELPGNLHFTSPNPEIPALNDGRIKVLKISSCT